VSASLTRSDLPCRIGSRSHEQGAGAPAEHALVTSVAEAALHLPSENNMVARASKGMIRAGDVGPDEVRT
jgi:hypothetical protein